MRRNFSQNKWRTYLTSFQFLFLFCSSVVYGLERGPITIVGGATIYKESPQSACEYRLFFLNPAVNPNIEKLSVSPIPHNSNGPNSPGPTVAYECKAKILYLHSGQIVDAYVGFVYPVCNIGDFPSAGFNSETICTISNTIPDKGVSAGQLQLESCIGNPVNAATGNKYTEEADIASPIGLNPDFPLGMSR